MMKKSALVLVVSGWLLGASALSAATLATSDSRETIITQSSLDPLSLGGVFEVLQRDVTFDQGGKTKLEAHNYYGYAGYDFFERLTLFGTVGASRATMEEDDEFADGGLKWSAGLHLKIWHLDIDDPSFIAGRASIRALGEYSRYRSGDQDSELVKWQDLYAAVTVNYEIFVKDMASTEKYPYSLLLYIGPAISKVDGKRETANQKSDFSEENAVGIAAGLEIFAAHNLSLGGQLQFYFDEPTFSASLMYNF